MRIKKVEISGFKSFCDPTRIKFDQPVTAIVGPNGCGKSNIVDAVRWALGEQSAKNLRGKGMEDVIFNGSESRGPQSVAEVTITFDNTDGLSHSSYLDFSEVSVTRRLYREGEGLSEYLVNNTPCRRMDITDLFLGTGGGARAYSIIEQGRIGLIVSSRSEDRRSMIEEAAGVTKYRSARRTAERRMEQTRQNLYRVSDVAAEVGRNLASLNRQAKKAERYKRYRKEQDDLELYVATHQYLELRAGTLSLSELLVKKEENLLGARTAIESLETRIATMRLEEKEAKFRLDREIEKKYKIDNEIQVLENEVRHLLDGMQRCRRDEQSAGSEEDSAIRQQAELEDELQTLKQQIERIDKDLTSTTALYQELASGAEKARVSLEKLNEEHGKKRELMSRASARQAVAETSFKNLGKRIEDAEARLSSTIEERASLEQRTEELNRRASSLKELAKEVEERLSSARNAEKKEMKLFVQFREEVEAADAELRKVRDELQARISRKASLEEVMETLQSHDVEVRKAVELLDKESKGLLEGLALDCIDCPERLDKALAAALNDRLQALLVESRETGLKLLGMLKSRDIGRVTVLSRNEPSEIQSTDIALNDSKTAQPLLDFLKIEPKWVGLFRHLLKNVFVVENLNSAEQLWKTNKGRAAFVTIDGQLLEKDGAMRGGRSSSAGSDLLGQKRQIRELSVEIDSLTHKHDELKKRFDTVKSDLRSSRDAGERAREEAQAHEIALAEVRKDSTRAFEDTERLDRRVEETDQEIAHQEEMLNQAKVDRDHVLKEAEQARTEVEDLEKYLCEQGARIEACRCEVEGKAAAASDVRVQKAALEQQLQSALERMEQIVASQSEAEQSLAAIKEKRNRAASEMGGAAGGAVRQQELLNLQLDEVERVQKRIEELRTELNSHTSRASEAEAELKIHRTNIDGMASEISDIKVNDREVRMDIEHLLDRIEERNHKNLLRVLGDYHLKPIPGADTRARIEELIRLIERMGGVNLSAIEEFEQESERHEKLVAQKNDLEQALENLESAIARIDRDSRRRFRETFEDVNRRFKEVFPRLFKGGRAELMLTDPQDLLSTGVDIAAQPPGKRPRNIELLSGGEKSLTAVALLFAIFLHRPSPFCLLDEVDAALDEANVDRFIDMVHQMTDRSQFIIITHSKLTMERSDALYGITMEEPGVSKMVSVRLNTLSQAAVANS
jgi:chromosome segregation protein